MQISYKYLIILVIISLAAWYNQLQDSSVWRMFEVGILAAGILLTGIPHGAMDHYIAKQQAINAGRTFRIWRFIGGYVFWVVLYILAWWVHPGLSFLLFLLLSAWHFGETDLKFAGGAGRLAALKTMVYGLCLLAWLLLNHATELATWIQILVPACTSAPQFIEWAQQVPLYLYFGAILILLAPIRSKETSRWVTWLLLSSFLFLCGKISLLGGFTLYFTGWHGVLAFVDINNFLSSKGKGLAIWRQSLPMSIISYTFLLLIYFFTDPEVWQNSGLPAMFILLSTLTLPHAHVMHQLYQRVETV